MRQLRTHLVEDEYLDTVERMRHSGYRPAAVLDGGRVRCVAGFSIQENLYCDKHLYVDDLITDDSARSQGHGNGCSTGSPRRLGEPAACNYIRTRAYNDPTPTASTSVKDSLSPPTASASISSKVHAGHLLCPGTQPGTYTIVRRRCSRASSGSAAKPVWTGEGCTTVLRGATSQPNR